MEKSKIPGSLRICSNCGTPLPGGARFCPSCGQKLPVRRLTLKSLAEDIFTGFLSLDAKWIQTIIALVFHPVRYTREYIEGKRAKYTSPFKLLLSLSVIYALIYNLVPSYSGHRQITENTHPDAYFPLFDSLFAARPQWQQNLKMPATSPERNQLTDSILNFFLIRFNPSVNLNIGTNFDMNSRISLYKPYIDAYRKWLLKHGYNPTEREKSLTGHFFADIGMNNDKRLNEFLKTLYQYDLNVKETFRHFKTTGFREKIKFRLAAIFIRLMVNEDMIKNLFNKITGKTSILLFLFLPVFTFLSMPLFGSKLYNFTEQMVLHFNIQSFALLVFLLIHFIPNNSFPADLLLWLLLIYIFLTVKKFFRLSFGKTLLIIFPLIIIYFLLLIIEFISVSILLLW